MSARIERLRNVRYLIREVRERSSWIRYQAIEMQQDRRDTANEWLGWGRVPGLAFSHCLLKMCWKKNRIGLARRITAKIRKLEARAKASANVHSATQGAGEGVSR